MRKMNHTIAVSTEQQLRDLNYIEPGVPHSTKQTHESTESNYAFTWKTQ